ncbi:hypothetical protein B0H10DRAFT_2186010 [Mycena sp. CBHHK59/15]|nr:hypothetical protein B0H10DRAFT_2186010 [Mycena sp. CBHHK59/15]
MSLCFFNDMPEQCIVQASAMQPWVPFHLLPINLATPFELDPELYFELLDGSVPIPRSPRGNNQAVYFHPASSDGDCDPNCALSWPPPSLSSACSSPRPSSACSASSSSSGSSVYFTPMSDLCFSPMMNHSAIPRVEDSPILNSSPTIKKIDSHRIIDTENDENLPPFQVKSFCAKAPACRLAGHLRPALQTRELRLKGWDRLRRNAPPALQMSRIQKDAAQTDPLYVLELDVEEGIVKSQPKPIFFRGKTTPEQRRLLLNLLINGV